MKNNISKIALVQDGGHKWDWKNRQICREMKTTSSEDVVAKCCFTANKLDPNQKLGQEIKETQMTVSEKYILQDMTNLISEYEN